MARQLLRDTVEMRLPAFVGTVSLDDQRVSSAFQVTEARRVIVSGITADAPLGGVTADLLGYVGDWPLAFFLTHPGRALPHNHLSFVGLKGGVVEITLVGTKAILHSQRLLGQSYREQLKAYLQYEDTAKRWIYHPRYERLHQNAKSTLEQSTLRAHQAATTSVPDEIVQYQCVRCQHRWHGSKTQRVCRVCNTHLFTTTVVPDGT